ncbi:MAG TPA: TerC family protein [Verrucomicrobiales bacterium]|nr:TerC family protein [Verrucomicrobiales bacterium]
MPTEQYIDITTWHWVGFVFTILLLLALDLGVFHRHARVVSFKEAAVWTIIWFTLSMAFAGLLVLIRPDGESVEFVTGYILELSLSMDNVFVIALIFSYFKVPLQLQHRVLFWGILGALVMRGAMIWLGVELIKQFDWMFYVFGLVVILSGIKMAFSDEEGVHPDKNIFVRLAKYFFPVSHDFDGDKFMTKVDGRKLLTPLALVLIVVETTDLIFAVDSIPAIFAVTKKPFIVFTSNVFAILGLRSLYFVLVGAIKYFKFLKFGLSVILVFIGVKMLIHQIFHIPTGVALVIVASIIVFSILVSIIFGRTEPKTEASNESKDH